MRLGPGRTWRALIGLTSHRVLPGECDADLPCVWSCTVFSWAFMRPLAIDPRPLMKTLVFDGKSSVTHRSDV